MVIFNIWFPVETDGEVNIRELVRWDWSIDSAKLAEARESHENYLREMAYDGDRRGVPDIRDLDLPGVVVLEGRDIDRAVKAADRVCDHITLSITPDAEQFYMTGRGDADEVRLELERDDLVDFTAGAAESRFTLESRKDMNTAITASADVSLELDEAFPLIQAYEFTDGDAQVKQMLAPRIELADIMRFIKPSDD